MSGEDIRNLEAQRAAHPDDPEILMGLAEAYEDNGSLGRALLIYAKAIERNWSPNAWVEFHLRFYPTAFEAVQSIVKALEREAQRNPSAESHAYLACGYAKSGLLARAFSEMERLTEGSDAKVPIPDFLRSG